MATRHYEVPTHLDIEDKVLLGLTVRQFLYLLVGSSAAYAVWDQLAVLGDVPRSFAAGVCVLASLAFALLRPAGRALEEWLIAALVYVAMPSSTTWQPREPDSADWRPVSASWQELQPDALWAESES